MGLASLEKRKKNEGDARPTGFSFGGGFAVVQRGLSGGYKLGENQKKAGVVGGKKLWHMRLGDLRIKRAPTIEVER